MLSPSGSYATSMVATAARVADHSSAASSAVRSASDPVWRRGMTSTCPLA